MTEPGIYHALTIAGSDSSGGAGIQADLKTMTCLGVAGASVLTAITAQNTDGVCAVSVVEPELVSRQLQAVLEDIPIAAAKTGMLANAPIINAVSQVLSSHAEIALVVDPVMVATSGARLLDREAVESLIAQLLPRAALVTPNLPEALALTGLKDPGQTLDMAEQLLRTGCGAVLIKGGHASGEKVEDWLVTPEERIRFTNRRINQEVHGTGCALSAAITSGLARGDSLQDAVANAIEWLHRMLEFTWQPKKGRLAMLPFLV